MLRYNGKLDELEQYGFKKTYVGNYQYKTEDGWLEVCRNTQLISENGAFVNLASIIFKLIKLDKIDEV